MRRPRRLLAILILLVIIVFGLATFGWFLLAEYHYHAAKKALDRYHFAEAREHLRVSLNLLPASGPTHLLAARAARQDGDFKDARFHLDACETQPGSVSEEDIDLERLLLSAQVGPSDDVLADCRSLIDNGHPATVLVLEALIKGFLRQFRIAEMAFFLDQWMKRDSANLQRLYLHGRMLEALSAFREAHADFAAVLKVDPERNDVRFHLAICLQELQKPGDAEKEFKYLRQRQPDHPEILVRLARAHLDLGRAEPAKERLDKVLASRPRYAPALLVRGRLHFRTGDFAAAEQDLRNAEQESPGDYQVAYLLYQVLTRRQKKQEAKQLLPHVNQARTASRRFKEIISCEIKKTPRNPSLYYELGTILMRAGATEAGVAWLKGALKLNPHYRPAHKVLAEYYRRAGDTNQSAFHRKQAAGFAASPSFHSRAGSFRSVKGGSTQDH
jgi:tetratricopeptide (TPR) repeat protein